MSEPYYVNFSSKPHPWSNSLIFFDICHNMTRLKSLSLIEEFSLNLINFSEYALNKPGNCMNHISGTFYAPMQESQIVCIKFLRLFIFAANWSAPSGSLHEPHCRILYFSYGCHFVCFFIVSWILLPHAILKNILFFLPVILLQTGHHGKTFLNLLGSSQLKESPIGISSFLSISAHKM